jgi:hypothetical protein
MRLSFLTIGVSTLTLIVSSTLATAAEVRVLSVGSPSLTNSPQFAGIFAGSNAGVRSLPLAQVTARPYAAPRCLSVAVASSRSRVATVLESSVTPPLTQKIRL